MPRVSTYLNFARNTQEAFDFYRSVFGTEFAAPVARFKNIPAHPGQPPLAEADKELIMHIALPILGGHVLMGTDAPESIGFKVTPGNNVHISLQPDTREEADRLFQQLSAGGQVEVPIQDMFWGDYFGSFTDRYGIRWMVNCSEKPKK